MNQVWSKIEEQFVRENAGALSDKAGAKELSEMTGRSISTSAWRKKRQKLGLRKKPGRGVCALTSDNN